MPNMLSLLTSAGLNDIHIPNLGLTETILQKSYSNIIDEKEVVDAGIFKKSFLRGAIPNETLNALIPLGSEIRAFATETRDGGHFQYGQPQLFEFAWNYDEDAIDEFDGLATLMPSEVDFDIAEFEYDYDLHTDSNSFSFELATMDLGGFQVTQKLLALIKENPEILKYIRNFDDVDLQIFDFDKYDEDEVSEGEPIGRLQIIDFDKSWDQDDCSGPEIFPDQITDNAELIFDLLESLTEPVRETVNQAVAPLGIRFKSKSDISEITDDTIDLDLLEIEFLNDTLIRDSIFSNLELQPFDINLNSDGNVIELLDIRAALQPEALANADEFLRNFSDLKQAIADKWPMAVLQKGDIQTTDSPTTDPW